MASFDTRTPSFGPMQPQYGPAIPYPNLAGQVHQNGIPYAPAAAYRSYGETAQGGPQPTPPKQPTTNSQIYTAVYSSVAVYEMEVNGIAVMKRRADNWLNATQILKIAGVDKGKRTKILEKEILTGQHEKVQGGYGRYQGTWISYPRGREFCRQYGVEELLRPLLEYDNGAEGAPGSQNDTPTKEQAMAANRKRFYNNSMDGRMNGQLSGNGTFFQNISPTASNALAAMNKAARFDSPLPHKRQPGLVRQGSHQQVLSQESVFADNSQQTVQSFPSDHLMSMQGQQVPPQYGPLGGPMYGRIGPGQEESQEPPRKRMRPMSEQDVYNQINNTHNDAMQIDSQQSFMASQNSYNNDTIPLSLPPLYPPTDRAGEEKRLALMDLFADPVRMDWSNHTAILHLSGEDLDIPLDTSANTALHWAATLSKIPLMRLLIQRGANIFRGNAAGQTPLMAAVSVNNSFDTSSFPDILEMLGPLIEFRDATGRTVLHHIAVSSGIQGRSVSSRYYLESLLEFIVRQGAGSATASQHVSFDGNKPKAIGLVRFMAEVVNVQDKSGNTALNLVARIGIRPIINQLDELGANFNIANHTGFRPTDFGVFPRGQQGPFQQQQQQQLPPSGQDQQSSGQTKAPSQIDQIREEIFATTTSILTQTQSQYSNELAKSQEILDQRNSSLRSIGAAHRAELDRLETLQRRSKERVDRAKKIMNLRRSLSEQQIRSQAEINGTAQPGASNSTSGTSSQDGLTSPATNQATTAMDTYTINPELLPISPTPALATSQQLSYLSSLPAASILRAHLSAYTANNASLETRLAGLKGRSSELEGMYRKVVALCTGVDEDKVDGLLEGLVQAIESEGNTAAPGVPAAPMMPVGNTDIEVGRVREFLRKVGDVEA